MKNNFTLRWTIANGVGLSLGFLAFLQFLFFYGYGLDFEKHWGFGAEKDMSESEREAFYATAIPMGLILFGIIFTSAQALVLRKFLSKIWAWILNGGLGFAMIFLLIWPLRAIWGKIPGPVEPLTILIGGILFMLLLQWRYLKKQGIAPAKPLIWYFVGIVPGVIPVALLFTFIWNPPWGPDVAIMGLSMGGSAGFLSARHFQKVLEARSM